MRVASRAHLTPLAVLDLPALVVLWWVWHLEQADRLDALAREQRALQAARAVNLAVWKPEGLDDLERSISARWQQVTGATPTPTDPATLAALFGDTPTEATDG